MVSAEFALPGFLVMCQGEWKLTLVVIGAKDLENISTFGKLDPYVRVMYGNSVYRSTTMRDGGRSPSKRRSTFAHSQFGIMKSALRALRQRSGSKCSSRQGW